MIIGMDKKEIKGKGWSRKLSISQDKYSDISKAIMKTLSTPMRFTEVVNGVRKLLPEFKGSVDWYTITVLRDLETKGKIIRKKGNTTTYLKR